MKQSVFIRHLRCDLLGSDKTRASKKPKRHGFFFLSRERFKQKKGLRPGYLFEKRTEGLGLLISEKNRRFCSGY